MAFFPHESRSLFGEIVDWMLVPLLVIWPMGVVLTHLVAQNIAALPFDRELEQTTRTVASMVQLNGTAQRAAMLRSVNDFLSLNREDQRYFQVWQNGRVVAGETDLPLPPLATEVELMLGDVRLRDSSIQNLDVRLAWVWLDTASVGNGAGPVLVQVAETLQRRKRLAGEIIKGVTLPQFFIVPLALLLVLFAVSRNMRPLQVLERQVRQRPHDDLSPLVLTAPSPVAQDPLHAPAGTQVDAAHAQPTALVLPQEVQPLVDALNGLLERMQQTLRNEKRFLADAAHQLKTPLAGLRMQAELAERESESPAELKRSLHNIAAASMRATHVVNQLLSLARAEGVQQVQARQPCDLSAIARRVAQDLVPHALEKSIALSFETPEDTAGVPLSMRVLGHAVLLGEMVRNVLSNALNYTPQGGHVTLRIVAQATTVELQVEDDGPGIALAERDLVLQPFYRSLGTEAAGSGLGLAIVAQVVQQHQARLFLEAAQPDQASRPGLLVRVVFERHSEGPGA